MHARPTSAERYGEQMTQAVLAALAVGVGALAASVAVVAMAAVLATVSTRAVLARFTAGWLAGVAGVAVVGLLLVDVAVFAVEGAGWLAWLRLLLGVLVVLLGARKIAGRLRSGRGDGSTPSEPGWMQTMRGISGAKAFVTALLLGSVNPKSAAIALAAVSAVVEATPVVGEQIVALAVFVVVGSVGVAAPLVALAVAGERAAAPLRVFVGWFARHSDLVLGAILLLLGVVLLSNAIAELVA